MNFMISCLFCVYFTLWILQTLLSLSVASPLLPQGEDSMNNTYVSLHPRESNILLGETTVELGECPKRSLRNRAICRTHSCKKLILKEFEGPKRKYYRIQLTTPKEKEITLPMQVRIHRGLSSCSYMYFYASDNSFNSEIHPSLGSLVSKTSFSGTFFKSDNKDDLIGLKLVRNEKGHTYKLYIIQDGERTFTPDIDFYYDGFFDIIYAYIKSEVRTTGKRAKTT